MLKLIGTLLSAMGSALKWAFPIVSREYRRHKRVTPVGHDDELKTDIEESIEEDATQ